MMMMMIKIWQNTVLISRFLKTTSIQSISSIPYQSHSGGSNSIKHLCSTFLPRKVNIKYFHALFMNPKCTTNQGIQTSVKDLLYRTTASIVLSHPGNTESRILSSNKYTLCCPKTMKAATFQQRKWIKNISTLIL